LLITDRIGLEVTLASRFPDKPLELLAVGRPRAAGEPGIPDFLLEVDRKLPLDMRGCCCLIGAGPWAEIYCGWVRQRGGVAIDIGSGFDLLDGAVSRPIHTELGLDRTNRYALRA
jgi:hypothetical protein